MKDRRTLDRPTLSAVADMLHARAEEAMRAQHDAADRDARLGHSAAAVALMEAAQHVRRMG